MGMLAAMPDASADQSRRKSNCNIQGKRQKDIRTRTVLVSPFNGFSAAVHCGFLISADCLLSFLHVRSGSSVNPESA
jgi:hypothetical protein